MGSDKGEEIADDGNLPVLPRTISDALCAVKSLGFKYLWVNRYCVPQDNFPDKHRLIRMMGEIYRNSTLTLIVAAGQGPDHGLPGISPGLRKAEKPLDVGDWTLVHHETNLEEEIKSSRWNSRAWTYQEALLSYRRLVFTESQTYFQCQSMHCLESISIPLSKLHTPGFQDMISTSFPRIFPSQGVGEDYYRSFYDRITEYTQRKLSYHKDALLAFQGVMQKFERHDRPIPYLCGLPILEVNYRDFKESKDCVTPLLFSMLWERESNVNDLPAERRREFPSWTWAGWVRSEKAKFSPSLYFGSSELRDLGCSVQVRAQFIDGTVLD